MELAWCVVVRGTVVGSKRRIGRVEGEERSTHFHSSLNSDPGEEIGAISMVLRTLARLILRRFSDPASTAMPRRIAGTKLASDTRIEYTSGGSASNANLPVSVLMAWRTS